MIDGDPNDENLNETPKPANDSRKSSGQDVGPPGERVDDEVDGEEGKTTRRQE